MIINRSRLRDEKIAQLREGHNAYAESPELIRIMKRYIERENLPVIYDETDTGCWFIPVNERKSS
ncbi:hypothetical protein [Oceanobacillus halophilus]|uniref:Uncharacterized protein n=1 Tax=Oceanobacillus halophilus TaxID=930130 RepID=A0A494ZUC4_9BACI|nr:hypothetical protein [Oceanobacillus halophilus]RKQ29897.1 hypothetical protein D8M06_16910 [Oceanobacillus halophilus]